VATNAVRLTKRTVDALTARNRPFIVFDADVKGFGLRVMPTGSKTFIVEYRPGAGGRGVAKRRLTLGRYGGAMTADQARKAAQTALATVRLGSDPQAEKSRQRAALGVSDLIDAFIAGHVAGNLKPATGVGYRVALEKLRRAHGAVKAAQLTRGQIAVMHAHMADNRYAANRFLAITSKLFSCASDRGLLPEGHANPAARVKRYKEESRERFLTGAELGRLGDTLRAAETKSSVGPFAVAAIRLLILTGARLREILHAKWEYVDFERGILFLPDSKTGKKPVHLNIASLAIIAKLPRLDGNSFLFPGRKSDQPRCNLEEPWRVIVKGAALGNVRIHDLRHTHASIAAAHGSSLQIIGALLGHSKIATTERYAHLADHPVRAAAEAIGATIEAAMNREAVK
jgi:integrase